MRHPFVVASMLLASTFIGQAAAAENSAITVTQIHLKGSRFAPNQAALPEQPVQEVSAEETFSFDSSGRYRSETQSRYPGDIRFQFLKVGSSSGSATVDLIGWRTGSEISRQDAERARFDLADAQFFLPHRLLKNATKSGYDKAGELSIRDSADRPARLLLDQNTGEIRQANSATLTYFYSDFVQTADGRAPSRVEVKLGERLIARWSVSSEQTHFTEKMFELPAGYQEAVDKGALRVSPLANNVFRIDGSETGYHMTFAVGDDNVVLFDAPVNKIEAEKFKALVKQVSNNKPISAIVVTHTHGDHIGGLAAYGDEDMRIYTGPGGRTSIKRVAGEILALKVEEIEQKKIIDLGNLTVVIQPHRSAHASEMLLGYLPATGILLQGDLFMMPENGPVPPSFVISKELALLIEQHQWQPKLIVSVHGRPASWSELKASLLNPF